jgi:hypothetical protein
MAVFSHDSPAYLTLHLSQVSQQLIASVHAFLHSLTARSAS